VTAARARLLLVRHGRSAHVHAGGWVDAAGVHAWRAAYDAAGIADDAPPAALVRACADGARIACSDLPRARASAARLAAGRVVLESPLLRESELVVPVGGRLRLPFVAWGAVIHAAWLVRLARGAGASPAERARAAEAAAWLAEIARADAAPVVAVTHGVFRGLLHDALRAGGWRAVGGRRDYRPWSAWRYERP
jgi:broad specificity phosphatase PhoE